MEPHDCSWFEFAYSRGAACINDRCPLHRAMRALAGNLAIGAALCRAHRLGVKYGIEHMVTSWNGGGWTYPFEPGCGRSAP